MSCTARSYYKTVMDGDYVCTVTEDEFVAEFELYKAKGNQIGLKEFLGLPTCVDMDRTLMISEAQKLNQKTYQIVVFL